MRSNLHGKFRSVKCIQVSNLNFYLRKRSFIYVLLWRYCKSCRETWQSVDTVLRALKPVLKPANQISMHILVRFSAKPNPSSWMKINISNCQGFGHKELNMNLEFNLHWLLAQTAAKKQQIKETKNMWFGFFFLFSLTCKSCTLLFPISIKRIKEQFGNLTVPVEGWRYAY